VDKVPCAAEKDVLNDPINNVVNGAVNKVLDIFRLIRDEIMRIIVVVAMTSTLLLSGCQNSTQL
jgi:prephenate dehydratase